MRFRTTFAGGFRCVGAGAGRDWSVPVSTGAADALPQQPRCGGGKRKARPDRPALSGLLCRARRVLNSKQYRGIFAAVPCSVRVRAFKSFFCTSPESAQSECWGSNPGVKVLVSGKQKKKRTCDHSRRAWVFDVCVVIVLPQ